MRINRNIVECKKSKENKEKDPEKGINRNIVECKTRRIAWVCVGVSVLIETLWNVKQYENGSLQLSGDLVLIETLWNVKRVPGLRKEVQ